MLDNISLSFLSDYQSLEEALLEMGYTKSRVKKSFTKKELQKAVKKK